MIKSLKIVYTALFTALVFISTIIIQIPSVIGGYINFGDCFVLLSAWVLGPYGILASALGTGLADILTGYGFYAPATIVIKGFMAIICCFMFKNKQPYGKINFYKIFCGILAELFMVFGYFVYADFILGNGIAALTSVPDNLLQGLAGIISSLAIYRVITKFNLLKY